MRASSRAVRGDLPILPDRLLDLWLQNLLAAVCVPTAPNPTAGDLKVMPISEMTATDWSVDEAMAFNISGGVVSPDHIRYSRGVERLEVRDR